jgi:hypothetical protein
LFIVSRARSAAWVARLVHNFIVASAVSRTLDSEQIQGFPLQSLLSLHIRQTSRAKLELRQTFYSNWMM